MKKRKPNRPKPHYENYWRKDLVGCRAFAGVRVFGMDGQ